MRVIFLESAQSFGGAQKSTIDLAHHLRNIGHEVLIVDFWGAVNDFTEQAQAYNLDFIVLDRREHPLIISSNNRAKQLKNYFIYSYYHLKYHQKFKKIVKSFAPDIVSVHNTKSLSILKRNSTYTIEYIERGWFAGIQTSLTKKALLKYFTPRILTVSEASRQAAYTSGITKLEDIQVLHDVIEDKVFFDFCPKPRNFNKQPIQLLHSGGFISTKGQHISIEIARRLKELSLDFHLVIMGIIYPDKKSNKYYNEILSLIDKYNLNEYVSVVVNEYDVMKYFKSCDVLVHPSSTEGLPRVALESLCFGKPIIANPVGGIIEVVIHNFTGYITDYNNVDQYVEYIENYIQDNHLYNRHSQNARTLIESNYLKSNQDSILTNLYPL